MNCRHCRAPLVHSFVDLGSAPPSNAYLTEESLKRIEKWFPLRVLVCDACWLVQTEDFTGAGELFDADYAYFSAVSTSWLSHCERYVGHVAERFGLGPASHVVEVAANDGYLLQYVAGRGIPCTGVEPTASTAAAARARGIDIVEEFFGRALGERLASEGRSADLTVANNVLAHVPDIVDFVQGFTAVLKPDGVATFEFPHLQRLVAESQFDTIYHEHFSYLSLTSAENVLRTGGLAVFDVEELPTHGGSLRVYAQRIDTGTRDTTPAVAALRKREQSLGMDGLTYYHGFQAKTDAVKNGLLRFLLDAAAEGRTVAAYGAAAKGNTLLNYAGVRPDLIEFVVDRSPSKAGKYMPGSRIPIVGEEALSARRPDYIVILPWNLREEVLAQLAYAREWGARFVTAVPALHVTE